MHAVVIGGRRGLGSALVRLWVEKEFTVSVICRSDIPVSNRNLHYFACDLTNHQQTASAMEQLVERNGKIDAMVLTQRHRGGEPTANYEWNLLFESMVVLLESLARGEYLNQDGSIVIINSIAKQFVALSESATYHAAKSAVTQLVRYYAVKLGVKAQIRVNSVSPAIFIKDENEKFYSDPKVATEVLKNIPLGRIPTAREISYLIDFLTSGFALSITGQDITIDGGITLIAPG